MKVKSKIESLLFISAKPMKITELSNILQISKEEVVQASDELMDEYKKNERGIQIIKDEFKYQMLSSPENSELIKGFIKNEISGDLSSPSLETLTIIAYCGPISKFDLEKIRGVNCSLIIKNLLLRNLIEVDISDNKKNDSMESNQYYKVSLDFIKYLGINNIKDLPNYDKLHTNQIIQNILD